MMTTATTTMTIAVMGGCKHFLRAHLVPALGLSPLHVEPTRAIGQGAPRARVAGMGVSAMPCPLEGDVSTRKGTLT